MKNIFLKEEVYSSISIDECDYTAESIASALIKNGVSPEQIIFKSIGTSKRSHKKDVSIITKYHNDNSNEDLFFLESHREGIYDTLPESIFHFFSEKKPIKNKGGIIEEIRRHREEEKQARFFFLPFEQEFFNIKRTLFSFEDEFEWLSNASNLIDIYKDYYPILNDLTVKKGYVFLRLIPLIHDLRDNFTKVEECLSMLLDFDVRIITSFKKNNANSYTPPELGFSILGTNTIIGNSIEDGEPDLDIILTINNQSEINDYLFFDRSRQLAEQLCDFFIGAQYEISISYAFESKSNNVSVDKKSLLGYNVYL